MALEGEHRRSTAMTEDEIQVPEEQAEEVSERWFVAPKTLAEMPTKPASSTVTFDAQSDADNELFLFSFPHNVCPPSLPFITPLVLCLHGSGKGIRPRASPTSVSEHAPELFLARTHAARLMACFSVHSLT